MMRALTKLSRRLERMGHLKPLEQLRSLGQRVVRDTAGDTLVETLAAIIVCTMATIILLTGTVAASNINKMAATRDQDLQGQRQNAENYGGNPQSGTVSVDGTQYSVNYYGGQDIVGYK